MADSQDFDPEEIADAISHSADAHGNNLFRAMNTGAFARLGLPDQVSVVKRFADKMPTEKEPKNQPVNHRSTAQAVLRGAGEGVGTGLMTGAVMRSGYWAKNRMNSEEIDYDMSEFFKRDAPLAAGVGAGFGAAKSGISAYLDQKKSRDNRQEQFNKLRQLREETDDKKRNMLALSLLSSSQGFDRKYSAPRKPGVTEQIIGDPAERVQSVATVPAGRPNQVDVKKHQTKRIKSLAEQHRAENKRKGRE